MRYMRWRTCIRQPPLAGSACSVSMPLHARISPEVVAVPGHCQEVGDDPGRILQIFQRFQQRHDPHAELLLAELPPCLPGHLHTCSSYQIRVIVVDDLPGQWLQQNLRGEDLVQMLSSNPLLMGLTLIPVPV